ncbi:hypothetical protein CPC08DRAFT_822530 [Agrocybe pediades]|nr:hypothetical protein CPC08DRAFT_822530 [Agrocybe pediades]
MELASSSSSFVPQEASGAGSRKPKEKKGTEKTDPARPPILSNALPVRTSTRTTTSNICAFCNLEKGSLFGSFDRGITTESISNDNDDDNDLLVQWLGGGGVVELKLDKVAGRARGDLETCVLQE